MCSFFFFILSFYLSFHPFSLSTVHSYLFLYHLLLWDLPFLPLSCFWFLMGVLLGLPTGLPAAQPLPLLKVCWLHHSLFLDKIACLVSYLSPFLLHPSGKGLNHLTTYLYGMHQVVPAYTYLFCVRCYPNRTSFPKKLEREPQNRLHFLPTAKPHPLKALTRGPLPCISWVQVGSALTLCACLLCLNLFHSGLHTIFVAFALVWFCYTF